MKIPNKLKKENKCPLCGQTSCPGAMNYGLSCPLNISNPANPLSPLNPIWHNK